jgi:tetratricopeptide (TPR) repeat protein
MLVLLGCAPGEDLVPVPQPDLEPLEAPVREAILDLRQALDDSSGDARARAYYELGRMYYAYDMQEPAEACFRNVITLDDDDHAAAYLLSMIHLERGELTEAVDRLQDVLSRNTDYTAARVRLGRTLVELGDTEAGREQLERSLLDPLYEPAARYSLGSLAASEGDAAAAAAHFEKVLASQPEASRVHYPLGQAYRKLGDTEAATLHVAASGERDVIFPDPVSESLLGLVSSVADLLNTSGRAYFEGEFEAAATGYRDALQIEPGSIEAHKGLAFALERLGDLAASESHLIEARRLSPDDPDVARGLGMLAAARGAFDEALVSLQRAVDLDPGSVEARLALAGAAVQAGRLDDADEVLDAALELDLGAPERGRTLLNLGVVASIRGDGALARRRYSEALAADPDNGEARLFHANGLAIGGDYAGAATEFAELVRREPANLAARLAEATALTLAGSHGQARARLEDGLVQTDGAPLLGLALAKLLATSPHADVRDGVMALSIARQLHDRRPSLEHKEVLAMAHAETGDFPSAVTLQRQLVASAREMGEADLVRQFELDLARYQRNEPSRAP